MPDQQKIFDLASRGKNSYWCCIATSAQKRLADRCRDTARAMADTPATEIRVEAPAEDKPKAASTDNGDTGEVRSTIVKHSLGHEHEIVAKRRCLKNSVNVLAGLCCSV